MLLMCDPSTSRKSLTLKYYAKKILYFLRQQNILRSLKTFMEQPADQQSSLEGEAGISVKHSFSPNVHLRHDVSATW